MKDAELYELLDAYLSGDLDEAGRTWLQVELAAADPALLLEVADQVAMDQALRVQHGAEDGDGDRRVVDSVLAHLCLGSPEDFRETLMARIGRARPERPVSPSRLAAVTGGEARGRGFRPWHAAVLTAAASLLVLLGAQLISRRTADRPAPPQATAEVAAAVVPDDPWSDAEDPARLEGRMRAADRLRREYVRRWLGSDLEQPPDAPEKPVTVAAPVADRKAPPAPSPTPVVAGVPPVAPAPRPEAPATAGKLPAPAPAAGPSLGRESTFLEARVESAEGDVFVLTDDGRAETGAGQALLSGQGLQTGRESRAVIRYPDGTRIELGAGGTISLIRIRRGDPAAAGKGVFVVEGVLTADVTKQPAGRPMVLATPQAEIQVLGTRFVASVEPAATQVEVREGRVRLTRLSDASSVEVAPGQFAVAAEKVPLAAKPVLGVEGLLMWLRLDEGGGGVATDSSGLGHHGYLKGGVKWCEGRLGGRALQLKTMDSVRVKGTPALRPARQVAVSLWVRPGNVDSGGSDVVSMGDSYAIRILSNGNVSFFCWGGTDWIVCTSKEAEVLDGRWHHVLGQKTAQGLEVCVDGVLRGRNPTLSPIVYSLGSNLYIGKHGDRKTDFYFEGTVDDVKIYNRSLSEMEIRALSAGN
jgi:hypothetical protein